MVRTYELYMAKIGSRREPKTQAFEPVRREERMPMEGKEGGGDQIHN